MCSTTKPVLSGSGKGSSANDTLGPSITTKSCSAAVASEAAALLTSRMGAKGRPLKQFTQEAVAERVQNGEVLIIVHHKVYNLTKWVKFHPGGDLAVRHMSGKDATDAMIAFHPPEVFTNRLPNFCIGELAPECRITSPISINYRRLETKLHEAGLFTTDYSFFAREIVKFFLLWVAMIYLALYSKESIIWYFASTMCAATLWHQAAFVAHDAGHSGISHSSMADTLFGIGLANFFGGLSLGWWKRNHNVHHIVTNDPEHDPDIQHVPFLAISTRFMDNLYSSYYNRVLEFDSIAKIVIPKQHLLFYVIMAFGRFNLYANSWMHVFSRTYFVPYRSLEIIGMLCFWVWFTFLLSHLPTVWHIIGYILVSHMATIFLHLQITLSHFGMSTVQDLVQVGDMMVEETYAEKAIRTTMDVDCPRWMDWFHGGLQFQVGHHLYPRVPRHNLRKLRPLVESFAKEHNLEFHSYGFVAGNRYVLGCLEEVAHQVSTVLSVDPRNIHIH
ncbi:hypothetical protein BASA50_008945 [Batrachochytrium salamandrivorans]|uniref:Cytochrome b5 heme-binding domain-containing protein n=1 Tax=Batrachochytrium salamandrivorans TaxID=1357716 RepID=A0ABQ8F2D6_9FUNG|nr:hypothetical protein BASA62_007360 [Batrachochytrium salamandrivorans]KAH6590945.1 hypothetical protein BASA50_008945 [Batrachochytrium salamandrivorans]KAH6601865.1 hypothetical protein BASA61_001665 [Batrachochytrium salamandrivorans]KAH9268544.1 hypothetical protein BASA84_000149 [Batrachochytrium salamandrivorans]KAH9277216.1 hypothetical protein BASA83_000078 [Batrachochytrium salamandrivorans]